MSVVAIDDKWFFDRGNLHDAKVTFAHLLAGDVEIKIDDEWVNERGLSKPEGEKCPVGLTFVSVTIVKGNLEEAVGGWISEVLPETNGNYRFVFADRDVLLIHASGATCEAETGLP